MPHDRTPRKIDVIDELAARAPTGSALQDAALSALAVSPDGKWIAAGFRRFLPSVALFSAAGGAPARMFPVGLDDEFEDLDAEEEREARAELVAEHDEVFFDFFQVATVDFSADGSLLAVLSMNHDNGNQFATRLEVFRVDSGERTLRIEGDAEQDATQVFGPASFGWHPVRSELVVAMFNGAIELWDAAGGQRQRSVRVRGEAEHFAHVITVAMDATGQTVAWVEDDELRWSHAGQVTAQSLPMPEGAAVHVGRLVIHRAGDATLAMLAEGLGGFCLRPARGVHTHNPEASWIASVSDQGSVVWGGDRREQLQWQGDSWTSRRDPNWAAEHATTAAQGGGRFAWTNGNALWVQNWTPNGGARVQGTSTNV